jgi:oligopeptide transport system permease protein
MQTRRSNPTPEHFVPLGVGALESERIVGRPIGFWEDSWNRLKKNRGALISLVLIILLFAMAFLIGPLLSRIRPGSDAQLRRAVQGVLVRHGQLR